MAKQRRTVIEIVWNGQPVEYVVGEPPFFGGPDVSSFHRGVEDGVHCIAILFKNGDVKKFYDAPFSVTNETVED